MRHGSSNRRPRNRSHSNGGNGGSGGNRRGSTYNRNQIFDSNGPDVRIRGTAHQVCEKYLALAKDANSVGDRILAESYLQHAEHYQRIINTWAEENREVVRENTAYGVDEQQPQIDDLSLPASVLGGEIKVESTSTADESAYEEDQVLETA
jgi:hypothetical protein